MFCLLPRRMLRFVLLPVAIATLACEAARCTTLQRLALEELAAAAPAIARVRCVSSEARWDAGRIWTFTVLEVIEPLKGSLPQRITLRLLGGKVGGLVSKVEGVPRFSPNEEVILFLQPAYVGDWTVVSWVQGTFRIRRDTADRVERVTQDTAGVALFDPATRQFERGEVRNLPLREFRTRLAHAIARSGGPAR